MNRCNFCQKVFDANELADGVCFDCSNIDTDEVDTIGMIKELAENTIDKLSVAKKVSTEKLKDDLVAEYMYENPEEYAKHLIKQTNNKKEEKKINNN